MCKEQNRGLAATLPQTYFQPLECEMDGAVVAMCFRAHFQPRFPSRKDFSAAIIIKSERLPCVWGGLLSYHDVGRLYVRVKDPPPMHFRKAKQLVLHLPRRSALPSAA